jgi:hypothetical protein
MKNGVRTRKSELPSRGDFSEKPDDFSSRAIIYDLGAARDAPTLSLSTLVALNKPVRCFAPSKSCHRAARAARGNIINKSSQIVIWRAVT